MHTTSFSRIPTAFWWIVAACFLAFSWQHLAAQTAVPTPQQDSVQPSPVPVELQMVLDKVDQTAQAASLDIAKLRIEKWKSDSADKQQAQSNADSVQRNLTTALPSLTAAVRNAPQNFGSNFKLYRNLNALYDVMKTLTETASAFGPKQDYQTLAPYADAIDQYRRSLGDYMDRVATSNDTELNRFREQARIAKAQTVAAPPKKVIIDDNQPVHKKSSKKRSSKSASAK